MSAMGRPEPMNRQAARKLAERYRSDPSMKVVSVISPYDNREYALTLLWEEAVKRTDIALPVLWADDDAREYGYVSFKT